MDADLPIPHDPEPIFESYLRSRIESEQIACDITEIIVQRPCEPVSDTESASEQGQAQRRWQTNDGEVWFGRVDRAVIILRSLTAGSLVGLPCSCAQAGNVKLMKTEHQQ